MECLRTRELTPRPRVDLVVQPLHLRNRRHLRLSELPVRGSSVQRADVDLGIVGLDRTRLLLTHPDEDRLQSIGVRDQAADGHPGAHGNKPFVAPGP